MVVMVTKQWGEAYMYHGGHGNQPVGGAYMVVTADPTAM